MVRLKPSPLEIVRFTIDKNNRLHRSNGQFASNIESKESRSAIQQKEPKKQKGGLRQADDFTEREGKMLSRRYVHYYACRCKTHSPRSKPAIYSHVVGQATGVKTPTLSMAVKHHNHHYPEHLLLDIQWLQTAEMRA